MSYFFLGSVLPPLEIGKPLEWHFSDLLVLLRENMPKKDFEKIQVLRRFIDLKNMKLLLQNQPIDPRGNLSEKELDEALVTEDGLPSYVYDYLSEYDDKKDQVRHFSAVFVQFFKEMDESKKGFLAFYFHFEHQWRLLLVGLRSKKMQRDLVKELQHEDFHDPLVAYLLAQKDTPRFEIPHEFQPLNEQLEQAGSWPQKQYEGLIRYRFYHLLEQVQDRPFSLDYVLAYFILFMLLEDWDRLNPEEGHHQLEKIVKS